MELRRGFMPDTIWNLAFETVSLFFRPNEGRRPKKATYSREERARRRVCGARLGDSLSASDDHDYGAAAHTDRHESSIGRASRFQIL